MSEVVAFVSDHLRASIEALQATAPEPGSPLDL
jgi:hypothetical protein